jgi:signal transduction histidine kinase
MSKTERLWLAVAPAALAAGVAAFTITLTSDHQDRPGLRAALVLVGGWSFIAAGLIARTRQPQNRTGLLLIAVGFWWLVGSLYASNESLVFTIGLVLGVISAAVLVHLLLAYPSGRLGSSWELGLVISGYVLTTLAHFPGLLFQRTPFEGCTECPDNAFLVVASGATADILRRLIEVVAVVYLLAVVATLVRRWRRSSPAARRTLTPVLLGGVTTLLLFAISVGSMEFWLDLSTATGWAAEFAVVAVPFLFLWGLVRSRLARADISRALADEPAGGVQERVRQLLHDPSAEILYRCAAPGEDCVDVNGRPRKAVAEPGRALTPIERGGRPLAVLVHDEALLEEPELLAQVAAAVGLEVERDNNLFALQASERRSRALLDALPDKMFRLSGDGIVLDIQENLSMPPARVKVGSSIHDSPAPHELKARVMDVGHRALASGEVQTFEWELETDGDLRYQEGRFIPSGENEFYVVVRDVTDRKRQEAEQEALHRVALAVAAGDQAEPILDLVCREIGGLLRAHSANLVRFEPGGLEAVIVGVWHEEGAYSRAVGERFWMEGTASQAVFRTGAPVRFQPGDASAPPWLRKHMLERGIGSLIATPITVASHPWGAVVATLKAPHTFPPAAEERLGAFTQLVSVALANEEARDQLAASRARLVSAGDEERRRLERNLHDGAQQRLVSVSVSLRLAQARLAADREAADELLSGASAELAVALEELRELARGIHPAVLTERGLGPALASLADRAPLPVEVEHLADERLPRPVEAAAYYVVSEALANVAKYAHASTVNVRVAQENGFAVVEVVDNGVGGADPDRGSGLRGLTDRVEALEGRLQINSPAGRGTAIRVELPVGLASPQDSGQPPVHERPSLPALDT